MNKIYVILKLTALLASISAQIISKGACPDNVKVIPNFNLNKYLGKWYEYAKYPTTFENNGKCIKAEYSLDDEEDTIKVKNSLIDETTNAYSEILAMANVVSNAKWFVKFPFAPVINVSSNYWILDTDYDNYAVVYSCLPLPVDTHAIFVWILTRQSLPEADFIIKSVNVLKNNNISINELKITNNISSCNDEEKHQENDQENFKENNEEKDQ